MHDATDPRPPHSIIPEAITAPILVGYNGSTSSRHALAYAAGMARRMARPLMLAHVQPTPGRYAIAGQWIPPSEDPAELLDWMHTALTETIGPHGLTVQLVQRNGDAARQLAELASETHADAGAGLRAEPEKGAKPAGVTGVPQQGAGVNDAVVPDQADRVSPGRGRSARGVGGPHVVRR